MPPAKNPNPDRAKRARPTVEYANLEPANVCNADEDSDASDEVVTVDPPKGRAAVVVRQEGGPGPVMLMDLTPARATGVNRLTVPLRRHNEPKRSHPAWAFVSVLDDTKDRNSPLVQCLCGNTFNGTSTRITAHVLGLRGSKACEGSGPAVEAAKVRLVAHVAKEDAKKAKKERVALANTAARALPLSVNTADSPSQPTLVLQPTERPHVDKAIGRFFSAVTSRGILPTTPCGTLSCAPSSARPPYTNPPTATPCTVAC